MLLYHGFANNVEGSTVYTHLAKKNSEVVLDIVGINGLGRRRLVGLGEVLSFGFNQYKVVNIFVHVKPPVSVTPAGLFIGRSVVELEKLV